MAAFIWLKNSNTVKYYYYYYLLLFSHLADTFIQSDLQMRTTEAINWSIKTTKNRSKTKRQNFINTTYTHFKNKEIK